MIVCKNYSLSWDSKANAYAVRSKDDPVCPMCFLLMSGYDRRKRKMIDSSGSEITLIIRRLKCPGCGRIHAELPDCLIPQKHYSADTIADALDSTPSTCPADDSTIRRWKKSR